MSDLFIIDLIFFAVVFSPLLMIVGTMWMRRGYRRQLSPLSGPLAAVETNSRIDPYPYYQAELHGVVFNFHIRNVKNEPPGFYLSIPTDCPGHFFLRREEAGDRFAKSVGLSRELQTGDKAFDKAFDITVAGPREFARRILANADNRVALSRLVELGFDTVGLMKRRGSPRFFLRRSRETMLEAYANFDGFERIEVVEHPERVRESVGLLDAIRRRLPTDV